MIEGWLLLEEVAQPIAHNCLGRIRNDEKVKKVKSGELRCIIPLSWKDWEKPKMEILAKKEWIKQ